MLTAGFNPYRGFKFVATHLLPHGSTFPCSFVSIPIGFSSSLQQDRGRGICHRQGLVSIPIGFSSSLQPKKINDLGIGKNVFQSLSGFQVRCNRARRLSMSWIQACFNPYRVFKFVATIAIRRRGDVIRRFQSLSGFQVRCNGTL